MKLKQFIKKHKLSDEDIVIVHKLGKGVHTDKQYKASEIPNSLLFKDVYKVMTNYGGKTCSYNATLVILA